VGKDLINKEGSMSEEQQSVEVQENQAVEPVVEESASGDINVSDLIAESKKYRQ